jgi:hypothetical protein
MQSGALCGRRAITGSAPAAVVPASRATTGRTSPSPASQRGHAAVLAQRPSGTFTSAFVVGRTNGGFSIGTGDLDADGLTDLAVGGRGADVVNLRRNPDDTTVPTTTHDGPGTYTTTPKTAILTPTRHALLSRGLQVAQAVPAAGRIAWTLVLSVARPTQG